ncbi:DUF2017 family protein [Microbacterium cremeum]|uniref:DUF2017 family protein n=1 Tax=Microbacterium cremeum TaxID=2782169 RepID=UPI0018898067|nr:DUF2017 family protein [Microbacterium cremeum]
MSARIVVLELSRIEAAHLARLVVQFGELLQDSIGDDGDPAIARLVPAAYDDEEAAREFRRLTEADLLDRRRDDAERVLETLGDSASLPEDLDDPALLEQVHIRLDPLSAQAWLRTLAAIRLVLASRLGIEVAEDHDPDDPHFGIYDWLGYRLDGLVAAVDVD